MYVLLYVHEVASEDSYFAWGYFEGGELVDDADCMPRQWTELRWDTADGLPGGGEIAIVQTDADPENPCYAVCQWTGVDWTDIHGETRYRARDVAWMRLPVPPCRPSWRDMRKVFPTVGGTAVFRPALREEAQVLRELDGEVAFRDDEGQYWIQVGDATPAAYWGDR
jgi:hypothetical protein